MTLNEINIHATLATLQQQLNDEQGLSPALRSTIEMMLIIVTHLVNQVGLNSRTPPSCDPYRPRKEKKPSDKKAGGQHGHLAGSH